MEKLWYKNAIIYGLDVKTFQDSNGDGMGDFPGLTKRLPYLKSLGITCIWLLPFSPSPNRDNGYDVTDYCNVHPELGTLEDFRDFMKEATRLGLRVIIDLVVQHTSDQHPWFKAAQADKNSSYNKYYIWAKKPTVLQTAHTSFLGEEKREVWTYSKGAKLWYHHWFYQFQPDLDVAYPRVQEEIFKIVKFWMAFGVKGFRVDAVGLFFMRLGIPGYPTKNPGPFLRKLRQVVRSLDEEAILLGEADVNLQNLPYYFGKGERMHALLNFLLNEYVTYSIVQESALPIRKIMKKLPKAPLNCSWVNFIRNLDELNLERLGKDPMNEIRKKLEITDDMWIYNRGIRRRTAPLFKNNIPRLEMIWGLVFSLPGSIFIPYGDEIGMGDDLSLPFRLSVRTPMQWDRSKNGGFSDAPRKSLILPVISKGTFSYHKVNVAGEEKDPDSHLTFIKYLIRLRKKYTEIGNGTWKVLPIKSKAVIAFKYSYKRKTLITLQNLSDQSVLIEIPGVKLFKPVFAVRAKKAGEEVNLGSYGQIWLRR